MARPTSNDARLTIRLPAQQKRMFQVAAAQSGLTLSDYLLRRIGAHTPTVVKGDWIPAPQPVEPK